MNIRPRDRDSLLRSLRAGVVPRSGLHLIQVGRLTEVSAVVGDCSRITEGGTAFRLVIGEYGSGKTFFLHLARTVALEHKIVTAHADLNPDRRLQSSSGQARSLYAELMRNIATRNKPDGGAMQSIVEKFVGQCMSDSESSGRPAKEIIDDKLQSLSDMVNGYDFAKVIANYLSAHEAGDDARKNDSIRWLRGEFRTKTDARNSLGVRTIIDDDCFHDQLKLLSKFTVLSGYGGLLIEIDEMVNLYKLQSAQSRNANYEQILRMLNDTLQGSTENIGFYFGGTPEFLFDTRRGLYGYEALRSRLSENAFARNGLVDSSHPVVKLPPLTPEEFVLLLEKIALIHAGGDEEKVLVDTDGILAFAEHCRKRIGDSYFRTPRTTITSFSNLLSVMEENPGTSLADLLGKTEVKKDELPLENEILDEPKKNDEDEDFSEFKL